MTTDKEIQRAVERIEHNEIGGEWRDAAPLRAITDAVAAIKADEEQLRQAVAGAREQGFSWTAIGFSLGVTRQSAHERFGEATRVKA